MPGFADEIFLGEKAVEQGETFDIGALAPAQLEDRIDGEIREAPAVIFYPSQALIRNRGQQAPVLEQNRGCFVAGMQAEYQRQNALRVRGGV